MKDFHTEELKELRKRGKLKEELVEDLKDEFDEERLLKASVEDLKTLKEHYKSKMADEIEEEAEEDLQMLIGAAKSKNKSKEKSSSHISDLKESMREIEEKIHSSEDEEEEETGFNDQEVLDLLKEYEDLPAKEAIIKSAHVMKGYLEFQKEIERELTYKELAEELKDDDIEVINQLGDYFNRMSEDQYTGKLQGYDSEEMVELSEKTVKKLS